MLPSLVRRAFRAGPWLLAALWSASPVRAAEPVSVLPSACVRRSELPPEQYKTLGRFLALGGGYRQWEAMDCFPRRLDDAALAATDRPAGAIVAFGDAEAFLATIDPVWFGRCTKTATPVAGAVAVDGAKMLALRNHLAELAAARSIDVREIGFAEALLRDRRALFALYLGGVDRNVYLECFEDLDVAVTRALEELGATRDAR